MRVAVAMSGGVDSSVAAALLKSQGHEVLGVTMCLRGQGMEGGETSSTPRAPRGRGVLGRRGRCGPEAVSDAQRVAARLEIRLHALDLQEVFEAMVVADFLAEYERGRTPNPCVRCNEKVKFGVLLERATALGAERLATGHHARISREPGGSWRLCRGADVRKDQSYFLYRLSQEQMERTLMPVGELTKEQVRAVAREHGLPVADKAESREICFVPDDDYVRFLRRHRPEMFRPGPILDMEGNELGRHDGIASFTVGQRKGAGLALGERRYVVRIEPERNALVLGTEADAYSDAAEVGDLHWIAGQAPTERLRAKVKIRHQHAGADALIVVLDDNQARVVFDEPQRAITPGQAAVFYKGDIVLGGGVIQASRQGSEA